METSTIVILVIVAVIWAAGVTASTRTDLYDCGTDWDGDTDTTDDAGDMLACLEAARAFVTTASDGTNDPIGGDSHDAPVDRRKTAKTRRRGSGPSSSTASTRRPSNI